MKLSIFSYKSFVNDKSSFLLEKKQEQIFGLEDCISKGIIKERGGYDWSEETQSIDFNGQLEVTDLFKGNSLNELPFKIGSCRGFTNYSENIKNLRGAPSSVLGNFYISNGSLISFEGCPETVINFKADYNLVRSLKGCPKFVNGGFNISNNLLTDLNYGPYIILGKPEVSGNSNLWNKKVDGMLLATLFNKMHEDINRIYTRDDNGFPINSTKIIYERVKNSIEDKTYVLNLLLENPDYSIFLKEFSEEVKKLDYLFKVKNIGLI